MAHPTSTRVLFIGGEGRSGSTVLDRILDQVPGFFGAGELREIWFSGRVRNATCGCGTPFLSCPLWTAIGHDLFGGWDTPAASRAAELAAASDRPRSIPALSVLPHRLLSTAARTYIAILSDLYEAIARHAGVSVIVDSSKWPSTGLLLHRASRLDVGVVHLVRDSRAVAYSWGRAVRRHDIPGAPSMHRFPPWKIAMRWDARNILMQSLTRSHRVSTRLRYEDLIRDPTAAVRRLVDLVAPGIASTSLPVAGGDVLLQPGHSVMGNPMRMSSGRVRLRLDSEWAVRMARRDRIIVQALSWPLLIAYGYRERDGGLS